MSKNREYNRIINILADLLFLHASYLEIRRKPENIFKGIINKTLDRINLSCFENIV